MAGLVNLHIMTIAHGYSEYLICQHIKSNLRLKHEIVARDKGRSSIQVNGLVNFLNADRRYSTFKAFCREYPDVKHDKRELIDFKIFPIMDLDDCDEKVKKQYMNGDLFSGHWLAPYIVPIFNSPNLECAMNKAEIPIENKKEYIQIFPTNHGDVDLKTIMDFSSKIKICTCTNMELYVNYCIEIAKKYLINNR